MAVQIPDPGTGNGQTGDNEFVFRKKVRDNFSDQDNAASREVGKIVGNVVEVRVAGFNDTGIGGTLKSDMQTDLSQTTGHTIGEFFAVYSNTPLGPSKFAYLKNVSHRNGVVQQTFAEPYGKDVFVRGIWDGVANEWVRYYNTANTTTDGNGYIKPSSPVLRVFNDRIEGNDDSDTMAATYTKNGVGDYTITGTTGLRTDGWYITIPNDINGNPKVAVTLDETDGVVTLRSYVRIFDMNTFKFVPDLSQPLDIPDGRWIDLRFNDLPDEPMPMET